MGANQHTIVVSICCIYVASGCVLSYNTVIGADFTVPPYSKITLTREDDSVFEDDSPHPITSSSNGTSSASTDPQVVGNGGLGHLYHHDTTKDHDDDEDAISMDGLNSIVPNPDDWRMAWNRKKEVEIENESEDEWEEEIRDDTSDSSTPEERELKKPNQNGPVTAATVPARSRQPSASPATNSSITAIPSDYSLPRFYNETLTTLHRGHAENLPVDNIVLEMAGLKLSHDASMMEYVEACFLTLFSFIPTSSNESSSSTSTQPFIPTDEASLSARRAAFANPSLSLVKSVFSVLKHWSLVFTKYGKRISDQAIFISGLLAACRRWNGLYKGLFVPVLKMMFVNLEMIEEDAVWMWEKQNREEEGDRMSDERKAAEEFLTWLTEAEEEESEDEEENEEEGKDDK